MQIFSKIEDVLDYAVSQEKAAQRFYTELADKAADPQVQALFRSLIEQEKAHEKHLRDMKKAGCKLTGQDLETVSRSGYLNARNVPSGISMKEAIGFALEKEKSAHMLYALLADLVESKEMARIFGQLAEQESQHAEYFRKEYAKQE